MIEKGPSGLSSNDYEVNAYSSKEGDIYDAYPGMLAAVKSPEELISLFNTLERSGVDINDSWFNLDSITKDDLTWEEIRAFFLHVIKKYQSGDQDILKHITRKHGLRDKIKEIAESEKEIEEKNITDRLVSLERSSSVHVGDNVFLKQQDGDGVFFEFFDIEDSSNVLGKVVTLKQVVKRILNSSDKSFRVVTAKETVDKMKKDRESLLASLRGMAIGDFVEIRGQNYARDKEDLFHIDSDVDPGHTVVFRFLTLKEMEKILSQTDASLVKFKNKSERVEKGNSFEDKTSIEALKEILPDLYPDLVKLSRNFLNKSVFYEEVLKYLPRSEMRQGKLGDCYLLAAINSLKKQHSKLYLSILSKSLRKGPTPDTWQVKFQGLDLDKAENDRVFDAGGWITLKKSDVEDWMRLGVKADLPDIILERAYASYVSRKKLGRAGDTLSRNQFGEISIEGGLGHRALHDLIGVDASTKRKIGDMWEKSFNDSGNEYSVKTFLFDVFQRNPEKYVVTANTPSNNNGDQGKDIINRHILHPKHAYSLLGINQGKVILSNPHNTGAVFGMDIDEFMVRFVQISYVELK